MDHFIAQLFFFRGYFFQHLSAGNVWRRGARPQRIRLPDIWPLSLLLPVGQTSGAGRFWWALAAPRGRAEGQIFRLSAANHRLVAANHRLP